MESHALLSQVKTSLSDAEIAKSIFPVFNDQRKTEFLVLRTCLSEAESRAVLGITVAEYNSWRNNDPTFLDWDLNHLHKIRGNIAAAVLKARFMRNVFLQLAIDSELLTARAFMPTMMSSTERDEAKEAAKRYGPQGVVTMLKALGDTSVDEHSSHVKVELDIKIDGDHQEQYAAKKANARALLDWAAQRQKDQDGGTIEGQFTVVEDDSSTS